IEQDQIARQLLQLGILGVEGALGRGDQEADDEGARGRDDADAELDDVERIRGLVVLGEHAAEEHAAERPSEETDEHDHADGRLKHRRTQKVSPSVCQKRWSGVNDALLQGAIPGCGANWQDADSRSAPKSRRRRPRDQTVLYLRAFTPPAKGGEVSAILAAWPGVVPGAALAVLRADVVQLQDAGNVTPALH